MKKRGIYTQHVEWSEAKQTLAYIRHQVFVNEQHVPADMELDQHDASCDHLLAFNDHGTAIGTVRLLPDGHIGRMAVLAEFRGNGVGTQLLEDILALAKTKGMHTVALYAQTQAAEFYAKHQFITTGQEFLEAGIPHIEMQRRL
jgi:predicted GNAT family N-acyltransferase